MELACHSSWADLTLDGSKFSGRQHQRIGCAHVPQIPAATDWLASALLCVCLALQAPLVMHASDTACMLTFTPLHATVAAMSQPVFKCSEAHWALSQIKLEDFACYMKIKI